ncbi:hypothetical protein P43SY_006736 [Pythium insidiosum]|uniref:Serine protease family S33 n=1 Tax=Pythium insidiosum TaxID=114742 RepID=A0AAD5M949_PYTIN|nr:hypothetical protein P43SY_006736 [Pythium insidiosum]
MLLAPRARRVSVWRTLLSVCLLSLSAIDAAWPVNGWHRCALELEDAGDVDVFAECATVALPLCHRGVCEDRLNRSVDVFVKRIAATNTSTPMAQSLWFLRDHDAIMNTQAAERQLLRLHEQLQRAVNVYLVDQRGTGRGTLLSCEASQATSRSSDSGVLVSKNEVVGCASDLAAAFGPSFAAAFSLTSAAWDVVELIAQLQPSTKSVVYGVGAGTLLVERMLHLNRKEIAGYVLDSTATSSGAARQQFAYRSRGDKDAGDIAKAFLSLCEDDALCSSKFETRSLAKVLSAVLQNLDAGALNNGCASLVSSFPPSLAAVYVANATAAASPPRRRLPPSYAFRRMLAVLMQDVELRRLIPVVIYRMNRCSSSDRLVLFPLFDQLARQQQRAVEAQPASSILLSDVIQFSELWESPPPDDAELLSRFTKSPFSLGVAYDQLDRFCAFTRDKSDVCRALQLSASTAPPLSYTRDAFWNVGARVPDNASVLLLHSRLDIVTPLRYAEQLFDAIEGNAKRLLQYLLREEERKLRQLRLDAEEDEMEFFRELMMQQSPSDWYNYRSNRVHL